MSLVDKTLKVETSFVAFGNVLVQAATDFKAKKGWLAVIGGVGSGILGALGQVGELAPDLADKAHLFDTVALTFSSAAKVLFLDPVAAPQLTE